MRALWVAALVLALATPAWAAPGAQLARPDARVTLVASDVEVGALLSFLAAVGGSAVTLAPEAQGAVRSVRIVHARVQDAFDRVIAEQGFRVERVEGRLVVRGRSPATSPSPLLPTPLPDSPDLLIPPQPGR